MRPLTNTEIATQRREQTPVVISLSTALVSRFGPWVCHPTIWREGYTTTLASCGFAAGKFQTRAMAEEFAKALRKRLPRVRTMNQWLRMPLTTRRRLGDLRVKIGGVT